jgi:hypothetical protein
MTKSYDVKDNRRTLFIVPTECTSLISENIEGASTCFGTRVYHIQGERNAGS